MRSPDPSLPAARPALTVLLALLLSACAPTGPDGTQARPADTQAVPVVDVVELSIVDAQAGMVAGRFRSVDLVDAYLARIAAIDDAGPQLRAVIALNPAARDDAAALDAERAEGRLRGPLHGIPVLVKDNIDVAGMPTTAGSLALAGHVPPDDAFLVARLREAGAVVLGKTNLSEWSNFRSPRSVSGWSSAGGQTRNPHVLDRSPCGSSSGTAAAIAASLAAAGVGTETNGSILCPAAVTGLVGMKPTLGTVSRDGIVPIAASQDTAGPMARSVADAALLLEAIAAPDPGDPASGAASAFDGHAAGLSEAGLTGRRIGVLRQAMGRHPGVDARVEGVLARLAAEGAVLVDVELPTWGQWGSHELVVLLHEFRPGLDRYLAGSGAPIADLAALVAWNQTHAERVMPWFGQEWFEQALAAGPLDAPAYRHAHAEARRLAATEGLVAALAAHRLDALLAPTTGPAWPIDPVLGDRFGGAGYGAAAVAGTPSLNLPIGDVHGLPIGISLLGPANGDAGLLALAAAIERTVPGGRGPPRFLPSLTP